jgi:hypothetical protein
VLSACAACAAWSSSSAGFSGMSLVPKLARFLKERAAAAR